MVKQMEMKMKMKMNKECCEYTYCALSHMYKHQFEKLGWMILAEAHGRHNKIENYLDTLEHLHKAIKSKYKTIKDVDKKDDLKIMMKNIEILIKHVTKNFK